MSIRVDSAGTDEETVMAVDILIGANGTNSIVTGIFVLDNLTIPRYFGCVT